MALNNFHLTLALLSWLILGLNATRDTPIISDHSIAATHRLEGEGETTECWNALLELKSCSNEIILLLVNGESYLGLECCQAIRVITRDCWPSMLTSIGYTSEEGDILRDYCASLSHPPPAMKALVTSPAESPISGV